ncbi:MAG: hypothetical protein RBT51_04700 [Ectothiorhodospiraceae bacterium]|jgi:hypothetical protein|nr:hypothetical protein [Ectothiorhodospiraceae bacterium]
MSILRMSAIATLLWAFAMVGAGAAERNERQDTDKAAASTGAFSPLPAGAQPASVSPRPGRLRFRNGPVCMCAGGLGETDIEAASGVRSTSRGDRD